MYKIEVDKAAVREVAELLKIMGVLKAHIYPELESIGQGEFKDTGKNVRLRDCHAKIEHGSPI